MAKKPHADEHWWWLWPIRKQGRPTTYRVAPIRCPDYPDGGPIPADQRDLVLEQAIKQGVADWEAAKAAVRPPTEDDGRSVNEIINGPRSTN